MIFPKRNYHFLLALSIGFSSSTVESPTWCSNATAEDRVFQLSDLVLLERFSFPKVLWLSALSTEESAWCLCVFLLFYLERSPLRWIHSLEASSPLQLDDSSPAAILGVSHVSSEKKPYQTLGKARGPLGTSIMIVAISDPHWNMKLPASLACDSEAGTQLVFKLIC